MAPAKIGIAAAIVKASVFVSLPPKFVAVIDAEYEPSVVGVPVICPEEVLIESPAGRLLADQLVIVPLEAGVNENTCPTVPLADCPGVITGGRIAAAIEKETDCVPVPPGPVAVMLAVDEASVVGVPVIAPVVALMERLAGKPVDVHDDAGRFAESVRAGVPLKAKPTLP